MASANPANPQTFNRYSYALNNPTRFTDPTGLITESEYDGTAEKEKMQKPKPSPPPQVPVSKEIDELLNDFVETGALVGSNGEILVPSLDVIIPSEIMNAIKRDGAFFYDAGVTNGALQGAALQESQERKEALGTGISPLTSRPSGEPVIGTDGIIHSPSELQFQNDIGLEPGISSGTTYSTDVIKEANNSTRSTNVEFTRRKTAFLNQFENTEVLSFDNSSTSIKEHRVPIRRDLLERIYESRVRPALDSGRIAGLTGGTFGSK
jgi:hypothetical protein